MASDVERLFLPADGVDAFVVTARERPVRSLRRDGYVLARYRAYARRGGMLYRTRRRSARAIIDTLRCRRCSALDVLIAAKHDVTPAVAAAALPGATVDRVVIDDATRRRAAMHLVGGRRRSPVVLKLAMAGTDASRGATEQRRLASVAELGLGSHVPQPLGHGEAGGVAWSAETSAPGAPFSRTGRRWRARHGLSTLDAVATWLCDLAVATAHMPAADVAGEARAPLRGRALERLGAVRDSLDGTVGVLAHGDLATGENLLVRGRRFTVIDWETAIDCGFPLQDLVPLLALGAARLDGPAPHDVVVERVVALCRGEHPHSAWLFGRVRDHLDALDLPVELAGPLAATAWGYQASMRERHDELVRAAGGSPRGMTSVAELVLDRWLDDELLATAWSAARSVGVRS